MKQGETIPYALSAMMEQDKLNNAKVTSKIIMSIETYQYMQEHPESAEDIYKRISVQEPNEIDKVQAFLKKW